MSSSHDKVPSNRDRDSKSVSAADGESVHKVKDSSLTFFTFPSFGSLNLHGQKRLVNKLKKTSATCLFVKDLFRDPHKSAPRCVHFSKERKHKVLFHTHRAVAEKEPDTQ